MSQVAILHRVGPPAQPALGSWRAGGRRAVRRHPEYGAVLVVVAAWGTVLGTHAGAGVHAAGAGAPGTLRAVQALPVWTVMCVAMMVPAALPAVRHVAANSLRWRRRRAVAQFLIAYT